MSWIRSVSEIPSEPRLAERTAQIFNAETRRRGEGDRMKSEGHPGVAAVGSCLSQITQQMRGR
jgi:hypothetical protein